MRNVLRRMWDAVPVRASRYAATLTRARQAELDKECDARESERKTERLEASIYRLVQDKNAADAQMLAMQRQHAEHLREQYQRFGGEPKPRTVPKGTRTWEYYVEDGKPEMRFYSPGEMPPLTADTFRCRTASAQMRTLCVTFSLGLREDMPPEAVALRVGQEMADAVLRTWRGQSALVMEGA